MGPRSRGIGLAGEGDIRMDAKDGRDMAGAVSGGLVA